VARTPANLAVSIIGIAGPAGGTPQKPVGLVYLGAARRDGACRVERRVFPGDRTAIRDAALVLALEMLQTEAQSG
jgi:nicotinamide-nucleotide amidase